MKKHCGNCACRQTLYTAICEYHETNLGYCAEWEKVLAHRESCDRWKPFSGRPRATVQDLDQAIRDVLEIQRLLGAKD